ncbi:MAG: dTMP kinase [Gammaproteobacteria bacterium]
MTGKFITLEGIEGVGKSTNLDFVAGYLSDRGERVLTTREPGGTPIGERLRELLLDSERGSVPDTCELLMMFAARAAHVDKVIRPALAQGTWVICDRFTDATYAYQGGGRGIDDEPIDLLKSLVQGDFAPDLTILLDATLEVSEARRVERGHRDRFESEEVEFFQRVRSKYLEIAAREPERVVVIDASRNLEQVQGALTAVLEILLDN